MRKITSHQMAKQDKCLRHEERIIRLIGQQVVVAEVEHKDQKVIQELLEPLALWDQLDQQELLDATRLDVRQLQFFTHQRREFFERHIDFGVVLGARVTAGAPLP